MTRSTNNVWLHRYAVLVTLATLFLVGLGGVVTTKGVGMAVPDWPTTYGENMFLFPYSKWVGGVFYEHSHRLVASLVGLLTIGLAVWLWVKESRRWLRWLGIIALVGVVFQGVLGGMRVVFDTHGLGTELGIFHAAVAQIFFLLVGSIVLFTSRWWTERNNDLTSTAIAVLRPWFAAITILLFVQLLFGAGMRHQHAGLAVPDFPLAYGKLWPATDPVSVSLYNAQRLEAAGERPISAAHIIVHMLHRVTAFIILAAIGFAAWTAQRRTNAGSAVRRLTSAWLGLVILQVVLGMATIWSQRKVDVTTAHVAIGALTFMVGWLLVLMTSRSLAEKIRRADESSGPAAHGWHRPTGALACGSASEDVRWTMTGEGACPTTDGVPKPALESARLGVDAPGLKHA